MSVFLGLKRILELDGQAWLLEKSGAKKISSFKDVSGPKIILSDFNKALTGIETVHTGKSYVAAIIEKKLRDDGDMEGASKVLLLHSNKLAGALEVFYASFPVDEYSKYLSDASEQKDHCLYVPLWSAMLRQAKQKTKAVVFQTSESIELLVINEGVPVHSARISLVTIEGQDQEVVLQYLETELRQVEASKAVSIREVSWFFWSGESSLSNMAEAFESLSGRIVSVEGKSLLKINGEETETNVNVLFNNVSAIDAVKTGGLYLYFVEKTVPWVAGLVIALGAGLFLAGLNWQETSNHYSNATQNLLVSSQFETRFIKAKEQALVQNEDLILGQEESDFIHSLYAVATSPSILQVISDIKNSVSSSIEVSKIQLNNGADPLLREIIIYGRIEENLGVASKQVQVVVNSLKNKGYRVEDRGFVASDGGNRFQLVLTSADRK